MNESVNEFFGFKVSMAGGLTWLTSMLQGVDLTQMLGFVALVLGLFIQIISFYRNKKADQRSKEADDRDKMQHDLEMKLLARQLAEIEKK